MRPFILWQLLLLASASQQVEFWAKSNASDGGCGVSNCGTNGLCAYAEDANMPWCCNTYETYCWGFAQRCVGSEGDSSQLFCSSGGSTWCCNKQYETCTEKEGQINVCIASGFNNPIAEGPQSLRPGSTSTLASGSISSATKTSSSSSSSSSHSSTSITASSSSMITPDALSGSTGSTTSGSSESASPASPPQESNTSSSSSGISTSAAAGAGVGGVLGLALIIGIGFFLGKKYANSKNKGSEAPSSAPYLPQYQGPYPEHTTEEMYEDGAYSDSRCSISNPQYRPEIQGTEVPRPVHELRA